MSDIATGQTTATLWDAACREHGDRPFLVHLGCSGRRASFTYAEFNACIHRCAHALRSIGVGHGDVVFMHLGNRPEMLGVLFGVTELGAIAVPLGLDASPAELLQTYRASGARWAVVEEPRLAEHLSLRGVKGVALQEVLVVCGENREPAGRPTCTAGVHGLETVCARQPEEAVPDTRVDSRDVAQLLYTSGTTAAPKGVEITHANLLFAGQYGVWQTTLRPEDRLFTAMPACHSNFQLAALLPAVAAGATLVMAERYSASRFWAQVRAEQGTVVQLIAMMARTLMLQPPSPLDGEHQVREALYFMPLSDAEKESFERRFRIRLLNSYGSTESIGWAVTDPPVGERRWPSVGRAGLGYEVGIFDEDGREVPPGQLGEFRIKGVPGLSLMKGYRDDPAATRAGLTTDGWLRTHDVGYMDADGWFYFVDRSVNVIKRAGRNISAAEVECVLSSHPAIAEAAVIGVPDPMRDFAVKAFIRLLPDAQLTADEVIGHCYRSLAPYKVPQIVEFVDDFPRTRSLKIAKRLLNTETPAPAGGTPRKG